MRRRAPQAQRVIRSLRRLTRARALLATSPLRPPRVAQPTASPTVAPRAPPEDRVLLSPDELGVTILMHFKADVPAATTFVVGPKGVSAPLSGATEGDKSKSNEGANSATDKFAAPSWD